MKGHGRDPDRQWLSSFYAALRCRQGLLWLPTMKQGQTELPEIALLGTGGDHAADPGDQFGRDASWLLQTLICPVHRSVQELPKWAGGIALMEGSWPTSERHRIPGQGLGTQGKVTSIRQMQPRDARVDNHALKWTSLMVSKRRDKTGHLPCIRKSESDRLTRLDAVLSGDDTSETNKCDRGAEWAAEVAFTRREPGLGEAE